MKFFDKKGQNTAEYAILIALVVAAAIAMQTYVKRGMQGGVKFTVDKLNDRDGKGTAGTGQYEPYYLESSYDTTQSAYKDTVKTEEGGIVTRTLGAETGKEHTTTRTGYQKTKGTADAD